MYSQRYTLGDEDRLTVLIPQTLNTLYAQDKNLKCFINVQNRTNKVLEFTSRNNPVFAVNPKADFSFEVPNSAFSDLKFVVNITELDNTLINDYSNDILVTFTIGSSLGYGNNYNTNYYNLSNTIREKINIPMWSYSSDSEGVPKYQLEFLDVIDEEHTTKYINRSPLYNIENVKVDKRYINSIRIYGNIFYRLALKPYQYSTEGSNTHPNFMMFSTTNLFKGDNAYIQPYARCLIPINYQLMEKVNNYKYKSRSSNDSGRESSFGYADYTINTALGNYINSEFNIYGSDNKNILNPHNSTYNILDNCDFAQLQLNDIYYQQQIFKEIYNDTGANTIENGTVADIVKSIWDIGVTHTIDKTYKINNVVDIAQINYHQNVKVGIGINSKEQWNYYIMVYSIPSLYIEVA